MRLKQNLSIALALAIICSGCNANSPDNKFLLAEKLLEDKKYEASVSEFQEIVNKAPNSNIGIEAQYKIAQIQQHYLGRSKEAIEAYSEFLKRNKDEKRRYEVERIMADLQFQNFENYNEAIIAYTKLVDSSQNADESEDLMFRIGRAFFLKAQFADAIKSFQYQKTRFPEGKLFWRAELEIGGVLSSQGKCLDANKQYDHVISSANKELKVLAKFGKASCFEELNDLDKAYELFSEIRSDYPAPAVVDLKLQKIKRRKIVRKR